MDYKKLIEKEFEKFVTDKFKKEYIRNLLLNHERKHILIDNLTRELKATEHIIFKKNTSLEEKRRVIKNLVIDLTKLFCKTAIHVAEKEIMSGEKK